MTRSFEDFAELRSLLDALCEETITAEQLQRLEQLILGHPEAEAYYVQLMSLHADLVRHFQAPRVTTGLFGRISEGGKETRRPADTEKGKKEKSRVPFSRAHRLLVWGLVAGVAASTLLAIVLFLGQGPEGARVVEIRAEPIDNSVAVLLQATGAAWEESSLPTRSGSPLPPGRLRLKSGFAHVEFYSGATVILEGPADFELISAKEAFCTRGKLRATVPPQAQGFTIGSPKLDLVDRGTEFGLQVSAGDKTEVHVFQGKVELYNAGSHHEASSAKELTTGQSVCVEGAGPARPIESDPAAFSTAQDVAERWERDVRRQQRAWTAASEALRQDASLVVYFPFQAEHSWSRTLLDQAGGRQEPHDGAIIGCTWVNGRWSGKQGLEFKRVSDRVRFHLPGEFHSLTLAAWIRVDALPNRFNSLMMTDAWDEGAPHWHISNSGTLELGVQGYQNKGGVHYFAPEIITPDRLGQWVHVAVVYDCDSRQVTHFVDGQSVMQEALKLDIALSLGNVELGNWNLGASRNKSPIRYFNGCMDEFMLFSRALPDPEIERLYTQGRPPL
jgi:hypothetical protein